MNTAPEVIPALPARPQPCRGLKLGGVEFSRTREVAHFFINGVPGAGKTVIIDSIIQQVIGRDERVIIHCPKGDFTSWLPAEGLCLFGPWDKRSVWWDIAEDVRTPSLADSFAMALFPDGKSSDPFWTNAARELFAGVMKYIQRMYGPYCEYRPKWSWDTLTDALGQTPDKFIEMAQLGDPNVTKIIDQARKKAGEPNPKKEQSKMHQSIVSTLAANIGWIPVYSAAFTFRVDDNSGNLRNDGFSISRWLKGDPMLPYRTLVLKNDANHKARGQQIFGALMACMSNYINSTAMPEISADLPGTWIILDEYPQLGPGLAAQIQTIEELGRSRGVRVVKAVQDEGQLYEHHGREKGQSQKSMVQTVIYCKTSKETAKNVAPLFDTGEVAEVEESTSAGGRVTSRYRHNQAPAVKPSDLTGLKIRKGMPWVLLPWIGDAIRPRLKTGAEIIVGVDDTVVKLLQPFPERKPEIRPKVVENDLWNYGIFKWAARVQMEDYADAEAGCEMRRIIEAVNSVKNEIGSSAATGKPFVFKGAAMMTSAQIAAMAGAAQVAMEGRIRENYEKEAVQATEKPVEQPVEAVKVDDIDTYLSNIVGIDTSARVPGDNADVFGDGDEEQFDDPADADIRS